MSNMSRFRDRNKQRIAAQQKLNSKFIFNGNSAVELTGLNDVSVQAAVVNQQEKDKAYVFTHKDQLADDKLAIGSIWKAKELRLLILEEIIEIKDVDWHKYIALPCNLQLDDLWGYFKGPQKSYINVSLTEKSIIQSEQKPVLVLPAKALDFEDKIVIKNRAWLVQEYDAISTPGIVYYSLTPSTVSKEVAEQNKDKQVYIEKRSTEQIHIIDKPTESAGKILVAPNMEITLSTEQGYFKFSNPNIKISKRSASEVIFNLPFGVHEVTIQTKKGGNIVEQTYCVE